MRKSTINYIFAFLLGFLIATVLFIDLQVYFGPEEKIVVKEIPGNQVLRGKANVVAVTDKGGGMIGSVTVDITDGNGFVLINTNPFVEPDTQYSANIAVDIAKNITETDLSKKNIIFNFDIGLKENESGLIGGPSAGIAMTIATIAAIENKEVKEDIVVTGAILPDGRVGWVGGIIEKGQAAVDNKKRLFLVPEGQTLFKYYEPVTTKKQVGGFVLYNTRYVPKVLDIVEYFNEKNLEVREVSNIEEVLEYYFP